MLTGLRVVVAEMRHGILVVLQNTRLIALSSGECGGSASGGVGILYR